MAKPNASMRATVFMILCLNVGVICLGLLAYRLITVGPELWLGSVSFRILLVAVVTLAVARWLGARARRMRGQ